MKGEFHMTEELKETIICHIENKMLMKVERSGIPDSFEIEGFPIMLSEEFLLMTVIYDFYDEGFAIVRTADITDAYSKESVAFYENICIKEGLREKMRESAVTSVLSMEDILRQLKEYDGFIIIQRERETEKCDFFIGKVESLTEKAVLFHNFDPEGNWDDDTIFYDDITQVTFGSNYARMYHKYMER